MPNQTVDTKVVQMQFDNKQFERKAAETIDNLKSINQEVDNLGAHEKATANLTNNMSNLATKAQTTSKSIEQAGAQFSKWQIIATSALATVASKATAAGISILQNVIQPLTSGGLQRALNLEQANFMFEGFGKTAKQIGSTSDPNSIMGRIYASVKGTFYSLDQAALIASQLMTTGIEGQSEEMTHYLRGVAGVASMTGAEYSRVGDIFTRVAGQGRLMGMDLMSMSSMGINAAATLGKQLGKTEVEIRDMVSKGKIDFETFAEAMYSAFGEQAGRSKQMFKGAMEDVKAALSRIGADYQKYKLVQKRDILNAAVPLVDSVHNVIQPALDAIGESSIKTGKKVATFLYLLGGIADYDETLSQLKTLVKSGLADESQLSTLQKYETTLKAIKSVLSKLIQPIKALIRAIKSIGEIGFNVSKIIVKALKAISNGLSPVIKKLSELVERLKSTTKDSVAFVEKMQKAFEKLGSFIYKGVSYLVRVVKKSFDGVHVLFDYLSTKVFTAINSLKTAGIIGLLSTIIAAINKMTNLYDSVIKGGNPLKTVIASLKQVQSLMYESKKTLLVWQNTFNAKFFKDIGMGMMAFATGLIMISLIPVDRVGQVIGSLGAVALEFSGMVILLMAALKKFQAKGFYASLFFMGMAFIEIAAGIDILIAGIKKFSEMDTDGVIKSLIALATIFALVGVFLRAVVGNILTTMAGVMATTGLKTKAIKQSLSAISGVVIALSISTFIMAKALSEIASIKDYGKLAAALVAAGAFIFAIFTVLKELIPFSLNIPNEYKPVPRQFLAFSVAFIAIGVALKIFASAMNDIASLDEEAIVNGGAILLAFMGAMYAVVNGLAFGKKDISKKILSMSAMIIAISISLKIFASAMAELTNVVSSDMTSALIAFGTLVGGLGLITGMLVLISGMAGSILKGAGAITLISVALSALAFSIKLASGIDSDSIFELVESLSILMLALTAFGAVTDAVFVPILQFEVVLLGFAVSLAALGGALLVFSLGLSSLKDADPYSIVNFALALLAAIPILALVSKLGLSIAPSMLILGAALAVLGLGMLSLSVAFSSIVDAVEKLASLGGKAATAQKVLVSLLQVLPSTVKTVAIGMALLTVGAGLLSIGIGMTTIALTGTLATSSLTKLFKLFKTYSKSGDDAKEASKAIEDFAAHLTASAEAISESAENFYDAGKLVMQNFQNGLKAGQTEVPSLAGPKTEESQLQGFLLTLSSFGEKAQNFVNASEATKSLSDSINTLASQTEAAKNAALTLSTFKDNVGTIEEYSKLGPIARSVALGVGAMKDVSSTITNFKTVAEGLGANTDTFSDAITKLSALAGEEGTEGTAAKAGRAYSDFVGALVDAGTAAVGYAAKHLGKLATSITTLLGSSDGVINTLPLMKDSIFNFISAFTEANQGEPGSIFNDDSEMSIFAAGIDKFKTALTDFGTAIQDVSKIVTDNKDTFSSAGTDLVNALSTSIETAAADVKGSPKVKINAMLSDLVSAVKAYKESFKESGKHLLNGLAAGLRDDETLEKVTKAAGDAGLKAWRALNKASQINSPSKLTMWSGKQFVSGWVNGITSMIPEAIQAAKSISEESTKELSLSSAYSVKPNLDISEAMTSAHRIDAELSRSKAISLALGIETKNQNTLQDDISNLVNTVKDLVDKEPENPTYKFSIPVNTDGRQIAKATAQYTKEELDKITKYGNRKLGIV